MPARRSAHLHRDAAQLGLFFLRQRHGEHPVFVGRRDLVGRDFRRQGDRAVQLAPNLVLAFLRLPRGGEVQVAVHDFDLNVGPGQPWQLGAHVGVVGVLIKIDRDTAGLLLLSKKRSALTALHEDLREGRVTKHYRVLAHGSWRKGRRVVDAPLQETLQGVAEKRMRIHDGSGGGNPVSAKTVFMPLGSWKAFCLLDAHLLTGRTHQIRVHLASVAHPILGDDKYGDADRDKPLKKLGIRRLMLHSFSLRFQHPGTGEPMSIEAPLPPDFQAFIARLEARADEERLLRTLKGPDAQPI